MKKALLIVDPQYDFINGSLPVSGAVDAFDRLAKFVKEHDGEYSHIIITLDWHPYNHSSFVSEGGEWPRHCVKYSKGASIWQILLDSVNSSDSEVVIVTKGTERDREEYSIFQNHKSCEKLKSLIVHEGIEHIDVCGVAGDVCVLSTLIDGYKIFGKEMFSVLTDFCPSIDGGTKLSEFLD